MTNLANLPLDGEFTGAVPSGDGTLGRRFAATFVLGETRLTVIEPVQVLPSGFAAQFSRSLDAGQLSLYYVQSGSLGAADVTIVGS